MTTIHRERFFFYILLTGVILFVLFMFAPFLKLLAVGAALAVVFHPIFTWINGRVTEGRRGVAALLSTLLLLIILGAPLVFIGARVFSESTSLYTDLTLRQGNAGFLSSISESIQKTFPGLPRVNIEDQLQGIASFFARGASKIFATTLHTILAFVLVLLSFFYFIKDGTVWKRYIVEVSPLSDVHDERILTILARSVKGVMLGYVLVGMIQGVLLGIGLLIFGVPNAVLFGLIAALASLIPSIGTAFISIPAVLFLYATGHPQAALGLLLWAGFLVGTVDNLLTPILVGNKMSLPPLLILFSVLGAIALLGPTGVIIGPLALSVLHTLLKIYKEDFQPES
jgi:predicted PurR-regulated permease PerM